MAAVEARPDVHDEGLQFEQAAACVLRPQRLQQRQFRRPDVGVGHSCADLNHRLCLGHVVVSRV